jgi:hypothetical protein
VVSATAFTVDGSGEVLTVHGVDITDEAAVRVYEVRDRMGFLELRSARLPEPAGSTVITRTWADRHGLRVDDWPSC